MWRRVQALGDKDTCASCHTDCRRDDQLFGAASRESVLDVTLLLS